MHFPVFAPEPSVVIFTDELLGTTEERNPRCGDAAPE